MRTLLRPLVLLMLFYTGNALAESELTITDARIMITPPGVSVTAGLMTVVNNTENDIKIFAIEAEGFKRVEMHKTEVTDGVARMRQEYELKVPANDQLILENGGYHMMLYTPERSFAEGDSIALSLSTSIGPVRASVPIKRHFAD